MKLIILLEIPYQNLFLKIYIKNIDFGTKGTYVFSKLTSAHQCLIQACKNITGYICS